MTITISPQTEALPDALLWDTLEEGTRDFEESCAAIAQALAGDPSEDISYEEYRAQFEIEREARCGHHTQNKKGPLMRGSIFIFLIALLFGPQGHSTAIPAPKSVAPELNLTIAVPKDNGERFISLTANGDFVNVVLRNVSGQPQNIWAQDCSLGYSNLTLEIFAVDDQSLPKPIIVSRPNGNWFRNRIRLVTLEPEDAMIYEVHLDNPASAKSWSMSNYRGFPILSRGVQHRIKMRAAFEVVADPRDSHPLFWTGHLVSEIRDYEVDVSGGLPYAQGLKPPDGPVAQPR